MQRAGRSLIQGIGEVSIFLLQIVIFWNGNTECNWVNICEKPTFISIRSIEKLSLLEVVERGIPLPGPKAVSAFCQ